jgi:hypothetical protein
MQVMNVVGIREFVEGKISDPEMAKWDLHGYIVEKFSGCVSQRRMFQDGFEEIFSGVIN